MGWLKAIILAVLEWLEALARKPTTAEDADAQRERRERLIRKIRAQKRIDAAKAKHNHRDNGDASAGRL